MMQQQCQPLGFVSSTVTPTLALGFSNITVSGTTTFVIPTNVGVVLLVAESSPVRWRDDGVAPNVTSGMLMPTNGTPYEFSGDIAAFKFISAATTAVLSCSFYGLRG
jgi:hypothetical protein